MSVYGTFHKGRWILAAGFAFMIILFSTACQLGSTGQLSPTTAPPAAATTAAPPTSVSVSAFRGMIRQVAEQVKPAVVQITNEKIQVGQFNQPFTVPAGVGSGIIYDTQGHILTNNHVVTGAQRLLVSLPDGRSFPGKLIGADPQTDLAVVQISGSNLPVAELGNSTQLQIGDWVVAIGDALALPGGPTVTAGVVSALDRTAQEPGPSSKTPGPYLFDLIQTDAPINPGNSGGPLVNLDGQVVGINTLGVTQAEPGVAAQGIGFAIAVSSAKPIADQLVSTGRVVHAYLGVNDVTLSPAISSQLSTTATYGAVVVSVNPGSPAATAGLQPKDVITDVDGAALKRGSALAKILITHKPGDTLTLTVLRGSQKLSIRVTLGETP